MNRYLKFGLPIAAIVGTLAWLGVSSTKASASYYKTIPEVKHMGERAQVQSMRVNGYVKPGSIVREGSNTVFQLVENPGDVNVGDNLKVMYTGEDPLPDTFKDRASAVAGGKLGADGVFRADQIQAKCASKYEGSAPPAVSASKPSTI